jgi:hypothetical protein
MANVNDPNDGVTFLVSSVAEDVQPVSPDDNNDLPTAAKGLRVVTGGTVTVKTRGNASRLLNFANGETRHIRVIRVFSTGTTAGTIEALI